MGRTKNVTVIPVVRRSRQEMLWADHKREPIHVTKKGLVFALFTELQP